MQFKFKSLLLVVLGLFALAACTGTATEIANLGKPLVAINAPPSNSTFPEGADVGVDSTSVDAAGVTSVDLSVDNTVVRTDPVPVAGGQKSFRVVQHWTARGVGTHTIVVVAHNAQNAASDPVGITVVVSAAAPTLLPTVTTPVAPPTPVPIPPTATPGGPSPTPVANPTTGCTYYATFLQGQESYRDWSQLQPGQSFLKSWTVQNTGTCDWSAGFTLAFVGGTQMGFSPQAVPPTKRGQNVTVSVPMVAPSTPGNYEGTWQLTTPNGVAFPQSLWVRIIVPSPGPPPTATPLPPPTGAPCNPPTITSGLYASPNPITQGQSTTLSWGFVSGASSAWIDPGVGGITTPNSTQVAPSQTTTYYLYANGCSGTVMLTAVQVNVNPKPTPQPSNPNAIYKSTFSGSQGFNLGGQYVNWSVGYYYNGSDGRSVVMTGIPLDKNGEEVDADVVASGYLNVGNGTASGSIRRNATLPAAKSTWIHLCMTDGFKEIRCVDQPYNVDWKHVGPLPPQPGGGGGVEPPNPNPKPKPKSPKRD